MRQRVGNGFLIALILFCLPAVAQIIPAVDSTKSATFIRDQNTYGTQAETAQTISNQDFNVGFPTTTWSRFSFNKYVTNSAGCCLVAPVLLPEGASITAIELEGCDSSTTGSLDGVLDFCVVPAGVCTVAGSPVSTGSAANPGCALFRVNFPSAVTVNNVANTYFFEVDNAGDLTGAVSLRAVRIYYKLQISPDPSTATFADVPVGHPFHRFVEALVAAGITAGCGGGNYCPDQAVTRGQMAVFLSAALGLHWAP